MICYNCGKQQIDCSFPPIPMCTCEADKKMIMEWANECKTFYYDSLVAEISSIIPYYVLPALIGELVQEAYLFVDGDRYSVRIPTMHKV